MEDFKPRRLRVVEGISDSYPFSDGETEISLELNLSTITGNLHFLSRRSIGIDYEIYLGIITKNDMEVRYGLLIDDPRAHAPFFDFSQCGKKIIVTSLGRLEAGTINSHRYLEDIDMKQVRRNRIIAYSLFGSNRITYEATPEEILKFSRVQ